MCVSVGRFVCVCECGEVCICACVCVRVGRLYVCACEGQLGLSVCESGCTITIHRILRATKEN